MLGTRCSWLHGDRRGFRDRGHRTHSSGDYKQRPPETEHAGLHRYYNNRSGKPVEFDLEVRILVCAEFVRKMRKLGYRIIACSVGDRHLHALVELESDYDQRRIVLGKCKQKASHAVRALLPGKIWSEGREFKKINDKGHLKNTYDYIRTKQEAGAIVWSHKPDEDWVFDESVGIVMMLKGKRRTRIVRVVQEDGQDHPLPGREP
jgi:REP element-mobilizing transposase RayT